MLERASIQPRRPAAATHLGRLLGCIAGALPLLLAGQSTLALAPGERVDNFALLDRQGTFHELYYLSDQAAVVILGEAGGCPASEAAVADLRRSGAAFSGQPVSFLLMTARADTPRGGAGDTAGLPLLVDASGLISESLDLETAGEALVIDPKSWTLAYRGDTGPALDEAIAAVAAGTALAQPAEGARTGGAGPAKTAGCAMHISDPAAGDPAAPVSYSETIAPMLVDNCVTCHRDGGIGPWAMTGYDMVRGFAPMIREVVRTRRMPPWHADPAHGEFSNDRSLTPQQTRDLVHWVEAGAPRGSGGDPLADYRHDWPEWQLGEPDLVIDIPAYEVPASGVVDYMYPRLANPHDRDEWVRAVEIIPGSRQALHHVITTFGVNDPAARHGFRQLGGLGGYVPGANADVFADGTGVLLPADAVLQLQMHYTTFGRAVTDTSRLGLYFYDEPPPYELETTVLMNPRIRIPANTKAHSDSAETVLERDILVYNLLPHAHYRGKASEFRAFYPDGAEELLLSVPNYDFNWQTTYELAEPKRLPAGTRIVHTTTWDNSVQNPANPDPHREVPWGQQSWDEMLFGAIRWRYADPAGEPDEQEDQEQAAESELALQQHNGQ